MGSLIEGVYTVETKNVSQLTPQGRINEELLKMKAYERMYFTRHGPFAMASLNWEIRVYPVGEFVWYYLCLLDNINTMPVQKYGYMSLVQDYNNNGEWKIDTWIKWNEEMEFKPTPLGEGLGLPMVPLTYFTKSDQEMYSENDCLLHKLLLWVILDKSWKPPRVHRYKPRSVLPSANDDPNDEEIVASHPSDLIISMLETGEFSDIILVVKKQSFSAHRCVLAARSPVFRSELLSLQKDTDTSMMKSICVSVQHMDPLTFKHLLYFIYTDSLPEDFDEITPPERYHRMLVAAHRFKLDGLKSVCEKKLTKAVADTMITALDLSEYHETALLKIVRNDCNKKEEDTCIVVDQQLCDSGSSTCTTEEYAGDESK